MASRTRNYATIVYPESAPDNWVDILESHHIPSLISPLHDTDCNPDGEIKKEHYHVIIMFDGPKTYEQASEICTSFGGIEYVQPINSIRGYARYLCHMDNPEKYQYSQDDVRCIFGADFFSLIGLPTDKYKVIGDMIDFCKDNHVYSYAELLEYCRNDKFDWFRVLCDSGTFVIKEYLKSKSWEIRNAVESSN